MSEWTKIKRKTITEVRPYIEGEPLTDVTMGHAPKPGDWIARDPNNHSDQWLITKEYFEENYEPFN